MGTSVTIMRLLLLNDVGAAPTVPACEIVGGLKNPLLGGGVATLIKKMQRYLSFGGAGEVRNPRLPRCLTSPAVP